MAPRLIRILVACLLVVVLAPTTAAADGDPASDTLLGANVFYPYAPAVSADLQRTLNAETAAAAHAQFPIKVALIASPTDLGAVPNLFRQPQRYADFLDQEISFTGKQRLLVVMPSGYGVQGLGRAAAAAAAILAKPTGSRSSDLARAAITAVPKLAAAAGHPLRPASDTPTDAGTGSRTTIVVILALAAVATAAALIAIRRRDAHAG